MQKVNICGVNINNLRMRDVYEFVDLTIQQRKSSHIITANVDHIVKLQNDIEFSEIYNNAALVVPDGMPIMWAGKFLSFPFQEKISGSDLFPLLCEIACQKQYKLFFLGGKISSGFKSC